MNRVTFLLLLTSFVVSLNANNWFERDVDKIGDATATVVEDSTGIAGEIIENTPAIAKTRQRQMEELNFERAKTRSEMLERKEFIDAQKADHE